MNVFRCNCETVYGMTIRIFQRHCTGLREQVLDLREQNVRLEEDNRELRAKVSELTARKDLGV